MTLGCDNDSVIAHNAACKVEQILRSVRDNYALFSRYRVSSQVLDFTILILDCLQSLPFFTLTIVVLEVFAYCLTLQFPPSSTKEYF